ncbi:unnamed protein product [marine sediment metagenome]|uniref:Uncharacterized protein n=1 Tax=marine sediment metagenome TaxID=412755 RepID=X1L504_9ZZZZ
MVYDYLIKPFYPINPIIGAVLGFIILTLFWWTGMIVCGKLGLFGMQIGTDTSPPRMTEKEYFANLAEAEEQGEKVAKLLEDGWSIEDIIEKEGLEIPNTHSERANGESDKLEEEQK